jgi:hypothetical protein
MRLVRYSRISSTSLFARSIARSRCCVVRAMCSTIHFCSSIGHQSRGRAYTWLKQMSLPFSEQLRLVTLALPRYLEGQQHITLCIGSGASRGRMPMLSRLISRTLYNLPLDDQSREFVLRYSRSKFFHECLTRRGQSSSNPTTLDEFRALSVEARDEVCSPISETYSEFFRDVQDFVGSKARLLELLEFDEFKNGEPNPCHYYIAYRGRGQHLHVPDHG